MSSETKGQPGERGLLEVGTQVFCRFCLFIGDRFRQRSAFSHLPVLTVFDSCTPFLLPLSRSPLVVSDNFSPLPVLESTYGT